MNQNPFCGTKIDADAAEEGESHWADPGVCGLWKYHFWYDITLSGLAPLLPGLAEKLAPLSTQPLSGVDYWL